MAGSADIRAGKAFVEVYADRTKLDRALKNISRELKAFGAGISSLGTRFAVLGGAIVTPLLAATKHFMAAGDQLDKMAARTGVSTNALSELGFAAEQSGSNLEDVERALRKMQKSITDAGSGQKTYTDALKAVGLSYEQLRVLAPEDQFSAIAEGLKGIADPTARAAAAMDIFGKSGTALLPMLGSIKELRAEAVKLGLSIGPAQAKQAAELGDAWNRIKRSFGAVAVAIGSELAPLMTGLAEKMKELIGTVREWVGTHKGLVTGIFSAGVAAIGAGAGLFVLGKAISFVGGAFSLTLSAAKAATTAIAALQSAAFLLANPFVAAGSAVVALGGYLAYTSGIAGKAAGYISNAFQQLGQEVTSSLSTIAESMAAGDLTSAAKVGWALIRLEWQKGVAFIGSLWLSFQNLFDEIAIGIEIGWVNAVSSMTTAWATALNAMHSMWLKWEKTLFSSGIYRSVTSGAAGLIGGKEFGQTMEDVMRRQVAATPNQIAANDASLAAYKRQIEAERSARVSGLGGVLGERWNARDAAAKAAEAAVDTARAEWVAATKAAAAAGAGRAFAPPNMPALGTAGMAAMAGMKSSVRGTFSASAVAGLGTGNLQARATKAAEDSRKIQKELLAAVKGIFLEAAT
jgi:hypothetical protein